MGVCASMLFCLPRCIWLSTRWERHLDIRVIQRRGLQEQQPFGPGQVGALRGGHGPAPLGGPSLLPTSKMTASLLACCRISLTQWVTFWKEPGLEMS